MDNKTRALELSTRMLTQDEFIEIVAQANALQTLDESRADSSRLDAILTKGGLIGLTQDEIPLKALYDNARTLAIDPRYITKALARYPTPEEIKADVESVNGIPTFNLIEEEYGKALISTLRETFPLNRFEVNYPTKWASNDKTFFRIFINQVSEVSAQRHFLMWRLKDITLEQEDKWAEIIYPSQRLNRDMIDINLLNPLFLKACKTTLGELEKRFKKFSGPHKYFYYYLT